MKVSFCELPAQLMPGDERWRKAADGLSRTNADLVLLNEMPFGPWLPAAPHYDETAARQAVALHETGLACLNDLDTPLVASSRPIMGHAKLRNEAFAWKAGAYIKLHQKHFFPSAPGFYEEAWFERPPTDFAVHDLGPVKVGVLLCSENLFNEWARHYGRAGAQIILAPRAGGTIMHTWQTAFAMAALVSGCYVISANRVGAEGDQVFGGKGFAYAPGGELIAETNADNPIATISVDLDRVTSAQAAWPCSIRDL